MSDDNSGTPAAAPYTGPDYGLGDDNALAHELQQRDWRNEPRTHNLSRMGLRNAPEAPTLAALSPEMAAPIREQLARMPADQRAAKEPELVLQAVRKASEDARILTGLGAGATPLAKAQVNIAYRERELERRIDGWSQRLNEVKGYQAVIDPDTGKPVIDPATGQPKMDPAYIMTTGAREAGTAEMQELVRQLAVLRGPEGDRELERALAETVKLEKERRQQREDLDEVDRRAAALVREDDLNRRAEAKARNLRSTLG